MSELTRDEVARIAQLSRLALSEDERQLFAQQLTGILDYVEQLRAVDTAGVPPTSHSLALSAPLRADDVQPSLPREEAVRAAPEPHAGLFKVPRVIGG